MRSWAVEAILDGRGHRGGPVPRQLELRERAALGAMALGLPRRAAVTDQDSDAHSQAPLVFVVNDDTAFLQLMQELLGEEGYRCRTLMSSKDAHVEIRENQPDLVILDIRINNEEAGLLVLDLLTIDP